MPKKSVTHRFFDDPKKYWCLIRALLNQELGDKFLYESLRFIYRNVFSCWPSSQEITQLKDFIKVHNHEILDHIEKCKRDPHEMLLLDHQKKEIFNKLKLFDVIRNIRSNEQYFNKQFIISLMEDAWGAECPKNGFSLAKSYLNKQYEAIQRNSDLALPDMCQGFKIINEELVYFKDNLDNIKQEKEYVKRSLRDKSITILKWLFSDDNFLEDVIYSRKFIDVDDIKSVKFISDSFMEDAVDVNIVKNFMKTKGFQELQTSIAVKKNAYVFHCGKCRLVLKNEDESIGCDSCMRWFHWSCVNINATTRAALNLSTENWYCQSC